jgi:alpha-L-fucosidase
MVNQFTGYLFVHSKNKIDLDIYNNDILRSNLYAEHVEVVYDGLLTNIEMPGLQPDCKLFEINNGEERNVYIEEFSKISETIDRYKSNQIYNTTKIIIYNILG